MSTAGHSCRGKMLAAIVRGDPAEVRAYIADRTFDANAALAARHGNTPLMVACAPTQKLKALEVLLALPHLDKDAVNERGMTALHQAAWYGQREAVEMLLRAGAAHEIRTPAGQTAGDIAGSMGHENTRAVLEEEAVRRAHAPLETAEELRARIKAQYCRARETAARRRQPLLAEPRPLPSPQSPPKTGASALPAPAGRPCARPNPADVHTPAPAHAAVEVRAHHEAGLSRKARDSEPDRGCEGKSARWMPSGASTARARVEKEDSALVEPLPADAQPHPRHGLAATRGSGAAVAPCGAARVNAGRERPESVRNPAHTAAPAPASSAIAEAVGASEDQRAFFITELAETPR